MFMPELRTEKISLHQPGNRRVRSAFGRSPINDQQTFRTTPIIIIIIIIIIVIGVCKSSCVVFVFGVEDEDEDEDEEEEQLVRVLVVSLYEGTLVVVQTTAQIPSQGFWNTSAQLASIFFLLATLTIAARCYAASTNALPLVHHRPPPPPYLNPIDYSILRQTSKLVLSRVFPNPIQSQSDTRVILNKNSKQPLHNQKTIRTKREFHSPSLNRFLHFKSTKPNFEENSTSFKNSHRKFHNHSHNVSLIQINNNNNNLIVSLSNTSAGGSDNLTKSKVYSEIRTETSNEQFDRDQHTEKQLTDRVQFMQPAPAHNKTTTSKIKEEETEEEEASVVPVGKASGGFLEVGSEVGRRKEAGWGGGSTVVVVVVVTGTALVLVTCLLVYQGVTGGAGAHPNTPSNHAAQQTPTTNSPMLSVVSAGAAAGMGGMDRLRGGGGRAARELAATRERQVRLHSVRTDIGLELPPSITLPDGEHDHPASQRLMHLRDPEQESEIYQKCIRAPPNRTVLESESPPPYRSSSAGVLHSFSSSSSSSSTMSTAGSDWSTGSAPLVVRCHSMSSTSTSTGHTHQPAQKTDFLQRTVKIFTGGGKKAHTQPPPPAPTLPPVVVVPVPHRPHRKPHDRRPHSPPV